MVPSPNQRRNFHWVSALDVSRVRGLRDRAVMANLLGCERRSEAGALIRYCSLTRLGSGVGPIFDVETLWTAADVLP